MVIRPEAIRSRVLRLEEVVSRLEDLRRLDREMVRASFRDLWAVERGLQLGAEIVFDIGNHLLTAHLGVAAQDYEDIVRLLGVHGVVSLELSGRLKGLGGFRNLLVHDYARLDAERVLDFLDRAPRDFSEFARSVVAWLDRQPQ